MPKPSGHHPYLHPKPQNLAPLLEQYKMITENGHANLSQGYLQSCGDTLTEQKRCIDWKIVKSLFLLLQKYVPKHLHQGHHHMASNYLTMMAHCCHNYLHPQVWGHCFTNACNHSYGRIAGAHVFTQFGSSGILARISLERTWTRILQEDNSRMYVSLLSVDSETSSFCASECR